MSRMHYLKTADNGEPTLWWSWQDLHGDNDWDLEDDAIFSGTYPAATVEDALSAVRASVMRQRQRNGGIGWIPDAGWPAHCQRA